MRKVAVILWLFCVAFVLILTGCSKIEDKYCYYKDSRGYIDKYIYAGKSKKEAIYSRNNYKYYREKSIKRFDEECIKDGLLSVSAKRKVSVLRYYYDIGVAKVVFKFRKSRKATRIDNRKTVVFIPMNLLHDSLPILDTVKFEMY
jgi:hypothetical protein